MWKTFNNTIDPNYNLQRGGVQSMFYSTKQFLYNILWVWKIKDIAIILTQFICVVFSCNTVSEKRNSKLIHAYKQITL